MALGQENGDPISSSMNDLDQIQEWLLLPTRSTIGHGSTILLR